MSGAEIAVSVSCAAWTRALPEAELLCEKAALAALAGAPDDARPVAPSEVSIALADDALVRDLNSRYRGIDRPTDVLSFPAAEGDEPAPEGAPILLGDVVLAYETVLAEAEAEGKPLANHLAHLVAHGVLHLLGYDHVAEDDAREMEAIEIAILAGLGIADPYAASMTERAR